MSATPASIVVPRGGPEQLLRVEAAQLTLDGATARMDPSEWGHAPDGAPCLGGLGVLLDDALGYAILGRKPAGRWSVSTEIRIEACGSADWSRRGTLTAEGTVVHHDTVGGLATGRILDADGTVVAVCSQRGRYVDIGNGGVAISRAGAPDPEHHVAPDPWRLVSPAAGAAGASGDSGVAVASAELEVGPWLVNPMGNLHGGMTILLAEQVAASALTGTSGPALTTASIQVTYLRPLVVGSIVTIEATVRHRGRGLALVDVSVGVGVGGRSGAVATVVAQPADPARPLTNDH